MTWKSTAAASGLMVVGTWLASYAPVGGPRGEQGVAPSIARTETAAAEIQREADRLHGRLQQVAAFRRPARNPFHFSARPSAGEAASREPAVTVEPAAPSTEPPPPPTLRLLLSGIAEDAAGGEVIRTAIISTPDDVYLVKVGETIRDTFKVTRIDAGAAELLRLDDGSTVQLSLRP